VIQPLSEPSGARNLQEGEAEIAIQLPTDICHYPQDSPTYSCCNGAEGSEGCKTAQEHVPLG